MPAKTRDFFSENARYHADYNHVGSSMISDWIDWQSPAIWANRYVFGFPNQPIKDADLIPPTKYFELGNLIHLALMDRDAFNASVAVIPRAVGRRGGHNYNDWEARIRAEKPNAQIVTQTMWMDVKAARRAVLDHELAAKLIDGVYENEYRWADHRHGIRCKIKPDILIPIRNMCVDIKTTRLPVPSESEFTREAYKLGYHRSCALQLEGLHQNRVDGFRFLYLVISTATYRVYVHTPAAQYIERGRLENEKALAEIGRCYSEGIWPDPSMRVGTLGAEFNGRSFR